MDSFPLWIPQLQTLGTRAALTFSCWIRSSPPAWIPILLEYSTPRKIHVKTRSQILLDLRAFKSSWCFQPLPPAPSLPTGASWSSRRSLRLSRVSRSWDEFQGMQTKLRINPQQSQIPGKFCLRENPTKGSRDRESFLDLGAGVWILELAIPVLRGKVSQGKVLESSGWMDLDGPKSRRRVLFGSSTPDWILALEQPPLPSLDHTSLPKKESMD